jgi:hypothetical protein
MYSHALTAILDNPKLKNTRASYHYHHAPIFIISRSGRTFYTVEGISPSGTRGSEIDVKWKFVEHEQRNEY